MKEKSIKDITIEETTQYTKNQALKGNFILNPENLPFETIPQNSNYPTYRGQIAFEVMKQYDYQYIRVIDLKNYLDIELPHDGRKKLFVNILKQLRYDKMNNIKQRIKQLKD